MTSINHSNDVKLYGVTVEIDLENSDGKLRPGMNTTVEIDVGTMRDVLSIPIAL